MEVHRKINRLTTVIVFWLVVLVVLVCRLAAIQIFKTRYYRELAKKQHLISVKISAPRGNIYDRNGIPLAINNLFYELIADPSQIKDTNLVDSILTRLTGRERGFYYNKIRNSISRYYVYLERKVSPEIGRKIESLAIPGISVSPKYSRNYPHGKIGSTVIGCVDADGNGIEGLELYYNDYLKGTPAKKVLVHDALGNKYPVYGDLLKSAKPGKDIYTTLDIRLQEIVDKELEDAVLRNAADAGMAIFVNPKTGEILAVSSFPNYDPNHPGDFPDGYRRCRPITDEFEPGSVFKIVTFCCALAEGKLALDDTIDTGNGYLRINMRDVRDVHGYGLLRAPEILINSSNVGIVKIAKRLDKQTFYRYIKLFGFGTITNVDFPGEADGKLNSPSKWSIPTMSTLPMGYEVRATAIQLACAYSAIANHGRMNRPFLVSKAVSGDGDTEIIRQPLMVRQVIPEWVSDTVYNILRKVVTRGTARSANSPYVKIAGKTGTSKKHAYGTTKYKSHEYYSSFAGIAPFEDPKVVGVIVIDNPKAGKYYGGFVAAPVFRAIIEKAVSAGIVESPRSLKLAVSAYHDEKTAVPALRFMPAAQAKEVLRKRRLVPKIIGVGNVVISQVPKAYSEVEVGDTVWVYLGEREGQTNKVILPDLRGLSIRDAMKKLTELGVKPIISGYGVVVEQEPAPFTEVKIGCECKVRGMSIVRNELNGKSSKNSGDFWEN